MLRLYTFVISHFSEKARFGLDLAGIEYQERVLLPGPHLLTTRRIAKKTTVPVLAHDSEIIQGSSAILDYAESRLGAALTPSDPEAAASDGAIEALADEAFGRGVQTIFYDALLRDRRGMIELWAQGSASGAARAFYSVAFPFLASRIREMYRITPERVVAAKDRFRRALDQTDRALEGRRYVGGDAPSRADISVAALLAPACSPPEHVMRWPANPPAELEAFRSEIGIRPTLQHVLRIYRDHRGPRRA